MATHSSVLAWRIPGTAEPGGLPSMGSHRVRHDWSDLAAAAAVQNYHMTQQSNYWTYTLRNHNSKRHVSQCSLQHHLQQPRHGSNLDIHQQMHGKRLWYTYTMEYYSAIKMNETVPFVEMWMDPETVIQSELSQKEKNKYSMLTHMYGV